MNDYYIQSVMPVLELYHFNSKNKLLEKYQEFSEKSNNTSGRNLINYNFNKSVHNLTGSFSMIVAEPTAGDYKDSFLNDVDLLDVVEIYEDETISKPAFFGVITDISVTAAASGVRQINISGSSAEYLFENLSIALDVTAMAWATDKASIESANKELTTNLSAGKGKKALTISALVNQCYNSFKSVSEKLTNVSNCDLITIFEKIFESNFLSIPKDESFQYPITSNLYSNSTITLINFLRNYFNENVYEIYGIINDYGIPKITVREKPFTSTDWKKLTLKNIEEIFVTDYTLTRSCSEVYNAFLSYVEGSSLSSEFYAKAEADEKGISSVAKNLDKIKIYGYKPLTATFIGFNQKNADADLQKAFSDLNEKMESWYGNLDEMYNLSLSVVNVISQEYPHIGERLGFLGNEFYVTEENHTWYYGSSPMINYSCERGGDYSADGTFHKIKFIAKDLKEAGL